MILSCWALWYGQLDSLNIKIPLQIAEIILVLFLATREAVAPLANDPIMLGTLIQLLRELEYQYLSTNGLDNFLFLFLAIREALVPLTNNPIKHLKHQNLSIGDDFIYSCRIVFSAILSHPGGSGATSKWSYHVWEINMMDILYGTIILLLYSHLNSLNIKICLQSLRYFFNSILAARGVVEPLANDPIMSGTSIWLFRHLKNQKCVHWGWPYQ